MHGVAVDPATGMVFTGNGTDRTLSKVDPATATIVASVDVPGDIDAIAYDPSRRRIYADQDGGGSVYVVDASTMKLLAHDRDAGRRPRVARRRPGNGNALSEPRERRRLCDRRSCLAQGRPGRHYAAAQEESSAGVCGRSKSGDRRRNQRRALGVRARRYARRRRYGAAAHRSMQHRHVAAGSSRAQDAESSP